MIRGCSRKLLADNRDTDINASIHNRFDIEVVDSLTSMVKVKAKAENVICNNLWEYMFSADDRKWNNYIQYGTGNGVPSASDNALFSFLGYGAPIASERETSIDRSNRVCSVRQKIVLSETTAVGETITEVGISKDTAPSTLVTHAMIQDMNGNPLSIIKTGTDIINIYSTVFVHWTQDCASYFGTSFGDMFRYACGILGDPFGIGYCFYEKANSTSFSFSSSYDKENKKVTGIAKRFGANDLNSESAGGLYSISSWNNFTIYADSKWYSPQRIIGESIGTGDGSQLDFASKFRDVQGMIVYVDGVQSSCTIDPVLPITEATSIFGVVRVIDNAGNLVSINQTSIHIDKRNPLIIKNDHHEVIGIYSLTFSAGNDHATVKLECSNSLTDWITISNPIGSGRDKKYVIPEEYRFYRYYKVSVVKDGSEYEWAVMSDYYSSLILASGKDITKNIHFSDPPEVGAVITADYTPGTIAKDKNHVFDFSVTLKFGEYTGT